jgi:hypothetical protein
MYTVKIYADDDKSKSGRRKVNKNTHAGTEIVASLEAITNTVENLKVETRGKINRIVLERAEVNGDLSLDFDSQPAPRKTAAKAARK